MFANLLLNSGVHGEKWSNISRSDQFLCQKAQKALPSANLGKRETMQTRVFGNKTVSPEPHNEPSSEVLFVIKFKPIYSYYLRRGLSVIAGASLIGCVATPANLGQSLTAVKVNEVVSQGVNGELVRWGGTIAVIQNNEESTTVEIVSRPLSDWGRPLRNDQTDGRFIARIDQILDPKEVTRGMDITLLGVLTDIQAGNVGETPYEFPVLDVQKLKVWEPQDQSIPYAYGFWHDPFNHQWPHSEHRPYSALDRVEGQFEF